MLDKAKLDSLGICPGVFSLNYPESQEVLRALLASFPHELYAQSWKQSQDKLHVEYLDAWVNWAAAKATGLDKFTCRYFTSGSSEGIRETIAQYRNSKEHFNVSGLAAKPRIHVFKGEYEGYAAYAHAHHVEVIVHDRDDWSSIETELRPYEQFWLSQPSSIDGNVWTDYDKFMQWLVDNKPGTRVMLDLAYLGCTTRQYLVNLKYPIIDKVFFSLSKVFGVYYHRIGGCLSRSLVAGLEGNKWFKNIMSMEYGKALMAAHAPGELAKKHQPIQKSAIEKLNTETGVAVQASDVVLLGYGKALEGEELAAYNRANNSRFCLTPYMDQELNPCET